MAQTVIEEKEETEVLDLKDLGETGKSNAKAFLLSACLPGLGQKYLDEPRRASFFFLGELAFAGGLYASYQMASRHFDEAKNFAYLHAGAAPFAEKGIKYYEDIADFYDITEHNQVFRLNRDDANLYPENEDWSWQWDSRENYAAYDNLLRNFRTGKQIFGFFIGGMVTYHIVSMIDAARLAKHYKVKKVSLSSDGRQLLLTWRF